MTMLPSQSTQGAQGSRPRGRLRARALRRALSGVLVTALAATGLATFQASPAHAEETTISDAVFRWGINNESNNAAFFGGANYFSAGKIGDPGEGGQLLNNSDQGATWDNGEPAGWTNQDGNVTIEKKTAAGGHEPATWAGRLTSPDGESISPPTSSTYSDHQIVIGAGTGTIDPETNTASIAWDGDATVLYYGGLTFWYLSDPELNVESDGTGELSATLSGYGTSMDDMTEWVPIADSEVTLADFTDLTVTAEGITGTPAYLGVEVDTGDQTPQHTDGDYWGSFPQSFVDFQFQTGQSSYWYSSGGQTDAGKVALDFRVDFTDPDPDPEPPAQASVRVSDTRLLPSGAQRVTVRGSGFDPDVATGTRPPLAGESAGAYVVFGKFARDWKPSNEAPGSARVNTDQKWAVPAEHMDTVGGPEEGAVELHPDGTFTTTLTVNKRAIDRAADDPALRRYGIYTYAGSGAVAASYETYTLIRFAKVKGHLKLKIKKPKIKRNGRKKKGKAKVKVAGGEAGPGTGKVKYKLKGKKLKPRQRKVRRDRLNRKGVAKFRLPKLRRGKYKLVVKYPGNANIKPVKKARTFRVKKK